MPLSKYLYVRKTRITALAIACAALLLAVFVQAAVKVFDVTFYLTNSPGGPETSTFRRGETVYICASPPPGGATLDIVILLLYPPEAGRPPITLKTLKNFRLEAVKCLADYTIQATDPEGTYAVRISVTNPLGDRKDTDLSFEVRSPIPWELIVPLIVVAIAGAAGFIVVRQQRLKQAAPPGPTPAPAPAPSFETQLVQPGTIMIRAPTGETMTLTAVLQAGSRNLPITRLPQVFGRADFVGIAPREVINAISRRHFEIGYDYVQGAFYIQDLGSTNGTYVNGVDIRGKGLVPLRNGDRINVAGVLDLTFVSTPAGSGQASDIFAPSGA